VKTSSPPVNETPEKEATVLQFFLLAKVQFMCKLQKKKILKQFTQK